VLVAPPGSATTATAIYAVTVVLLFGTSALYHRVAWGPTGRAVMKRLDHSMIFLLIAGTYTPFAVSLLDSPTREIVLFVIWGGAAVGIIARMSWISAPRPLIIPLYIALGWVAVFVMPQLLHHGGVALFVLMVTGGVLYSLGAVVYATRRPDPRPATFGYHEVFHACTLVAALCHYIAIYFAVL
jgi:hemolysin III